MFWGVLLKLGKELFDESQEAKGIVNLLNDEIKENSRQIEMTLKDGLPMNKLAKSLETKQYQKLKKINFDFNKLQKEKIELSESGKYASIKSWNGKSTSDLLVNIYDKLSDIKSMYPKIKRTSNRRWEVRVRNLDLKLQFLNKHLSQKGK